MIDGVKDFLWKHDTLIKACHFSDGLLMCMIKLCRVGTVYILASIKIVYADADCEHIMTS